MRSFWKIFLPSIKNKTDFENQPLKQNREMEKQTEPSSLHSAKAQRAVFILFNFAISFVNIISLPN